MYRRDDAEVHCMDGNRQNTSAQAKERNRQAFQIVEIGNRK